VLLLFFLKRIQTKALYRGCFGGCLMSGKQKQYLQIRYEAKGVRFVHLSLDDDRLFKNVLSQLCSAYVLGLTEHLPLFMGWAQGTIGCTKPLAMANYLQTLITERIRAPVQQALSSYSKLRAQCEEEDLLPLSATEFHRWAMEAKPALASQVPRALLSIEKLKPDFLAAWDGVNELENVAVGFPSSSHLEAWRNPFGTSAQGRMLPSNLLHWAKAPIHRAVCRDVWSEDPAVLASTPLEIWPSRRVVAVPWGSWVRGTSNKWGKGPRDDLADWYLQLGVAPHSGQYEAWVLKLWTLLEAALRERETHYMTPRNVLKQYCIAVDHTATARVGSKTELSLKDLRQKLQRYPAFEIVDVQEPRARTWRGDDARGSSSFTTYTAYRKNVSVKDTRDAEVVYLLGCGETTACELRDLQNYELSLYRRNAPSIYRELLREYALLAQRTEHEMKLPRWRTAFTQWQSVPFSRSPRFKRRTKILFVAATASDFEDSPPALELKMSCLFNHCVTVALFPEGQDVAPGPCWEVLLASLQQFVLALEENDVQGLVWTGARAELQFCALKPSDIVEQGRSCRPWLSLSLSELLERPALELPSEEFRKAQRVFRGYQYQCQKDDGSLYLWDDVTLASETPGMGCRSPGLALDARCLSVLQMMDQHGRLSVRTNSRFGETLLHVALRLTEIRASVVPKCDVANAFCAYLEDCFFRREQLLAALSAATEATNLEDLLDLFDRSMALSRSQKRRRGDKEVAERAKKPRVSHDIFLLPK